MSMQVIWHVNKGDPFDLLQGVIQGGIGSTSDFKVSLTNSIETVIGSDIGFHIGSTYIVGNRGGPFDLLQSVIQGGISSTSDFKVSLDDS